jgi:RHS repeat-associated protein
VLQISGYDGAMLLKGTSEQSTLTLQQPITTKYSYDARNVLARAVVETSGHVLSDLSYSYDGIGNLTGVTDAMGRGSLEIRPFKFDPARICSVVAPGAPVAPCKYRYDGAGNVQSTGDGGTSFIYDGMSRLQSARVAANHASFSYDPMGSPAGLSVSDGQIERREGFFGAMSRTAFFDSSGAPVTVGPPGATLHSFTELGIASPEGDVAAIRRSDAGLSAILYPIGEAEGTHDVLGGNGAATQAIAYDAYGNVLSDSGNPQSLNFWLYQWNGGHVLEGLGLVSVGRRVLDSRTGRFLQRDPVINSRTARTAHPYAFAWNNPASYVDGTGAQPQGKADAGVSDLASAFAQFIQNEAFRRGAEIDPYINTDFACDYDHNCMRAVEESLGNLTDFEKQLKEEYHVTEPDWWSAGKSYYLVMDRNSGAVLGYAFYGNLIEVYDRSGKAVTMIGRRPPLETTTVLDPIDFIGAGLAGKVLKKAGGYVARETVAAVEDAATLEGAAGIGGGAAGASAKLPPFQWGAPKWFRPGQYGFTTPWGDIYLNSRLVQSGTPYFYYALRHEGVHRFLSPLEGSLLRGFRARAKAWFYESSHLFRYTEEAWAETAASGSLRAGLRYPFQHPDYGIKGYRLVLEGVGALGAEYAGYRLADSLFGSDRDR